MQRIRNVICMRVSRCGTCDKGKAGQCYWVKSALKYMATSSIIDFLERDNCPKAHSIDSCLDLSKDSWLSAIPSLIFESSVFASAPLRPAQAVKAFGLRDMILNRFGVKPSWLLNAPSIGVEAADVSSPVGIAIRIICSLRLKTNVGGQLIAVGNCYIRVWTWAQKAFSY